MGCSRLLAGLLLTFKLYGITIRARDKFKGCYRFFYIFSMSSLILAHETEITAIRYLPASRRIKQYDMLEMSIVSGNA
ncbi:hypothetical protein QW71_25955 [Paenibacillus sp. IHB B 3415]|nr:hypothetical protein QW71_25955 [Paenibacillus sp. IHB B 3415]